jgi:hypothetical protein
LNDFVDGKQGGNASLLTGGKQQPGNGQNSVSSQTDEAAINAKEKKIYTGFVAQEVETAAKKINYDFSGVHAPQNNKDPYGLSYGDFVVPLVKAVQQLSAASDAKDAKIDSLIQANVTLEARLAKIEAMLKISPATTATLSDASMEQNAPNPFNNSTTIRYNLPNNFTQAAMVITDAAGKILKTVSLNSKGAGMLTVDANTLSAGAYHYSLYVDGKLIGTKQMLLAR